MPGMKDLHDNPTHPIGVMRQSVPHDSVFFVPEKCPYCGGKLFAWTECWKERDDGTLQAGCTMLVDCNTAPNTGSRKWNYWQKQHSEMPYVYMLPICERITRWVNERFNFDLDRDRDPMSPPIGYGKPVPHIP